MAGVESVVVALDTELGQDGEVERACPSSSWAMAAAATRDSIVGALMAHSPLRRPSALLLSASEPISEIIVAVDYRP